MIVYISSIDSTNNKFNYREFTIKNIYNSEYSILLNKIESINSILYKYKLPQNKFFITTYRLLKFNSYHNAYLFQNCMCKEFMISNNQIFIIPFYNQFLTSFSRSSNEIKRKNNLWITSNSKKFKINSPKRWKINPFF